MERWKERSWKERQSSRYGEKMLESGIDWGGEEKER